MEEKDIIKEETEQVTAEATEAVEPEKDSTVELREAYEAKSTEEPPKKKKKITKKQLILIIVAAVLLLVMIGVGLFFLIGKSELRPDEAFKLGRICQILKDNPDAKIAITGYADSGTGTADINHTLSEQRAAVVAEMLKKAGIAASRITSNASGSDKDASASPESNRVAVCIVK